MFTLIFPFYDGPDDFLVAVEPADLSHIDWEIVESLDDCWAGEVILRGSFDDLAGVADALEVGHDEIVPVG